MHKKSLLPASWKIPETIRDRLGEGAGRQRLMQAEGHLLLILHAPPQPEDEDREGRYFWRQPDGTWSAAGGPAGPAALGALLDEYEEAIDRLQTAEDKAQSAYDYFGLINHLSPLVRSARNLYNTLHDARQAAREDRRLIVARDRAYVLSRQAELLQADAKNALDFAVARRGEEQARSSHQMAVASHRLNLLVAFFFPIATLTAIFGANLNHGLERWDAASAPLPLVAVLGAGLLLGCVLTTFVNNKARPPQK